MSKQLLFEAGTALRELKELKNLAGIHRKRLQDFEPFRLKKSHAKDSSTVYYYLKKKGVRKVKYLGPETNKTVNTIKEAKYTAELLRIIDNDIALLEKLTDEYVIPDHVSVNSRLPGIYRDPVLSFANSFSPEAARWKRIKEAEKARHPVFRPEDLKHTANDGTRMRSLSEMTIANYLISLGITFVYELPLIHHGKRIYPDFTILSPIDNKTEIIIEHQGAMDSESYQAKYIRTMLFYLETKLVPNKDVFFTFNHLDGHLDLRQIDSILHTAFGFGP